MINEDDELSDACLPGDGTKADGQGSEGQWPSGYTAGTTQSVFRACVKNFCEMYFVADGLTGHKWSNTPLSERRPRNGETEAATKKGTPLMTQCISNPDMDHAFRNSHPLGKYTQSASSRCSFESYLRRLRNTSSNCCYSSNRSSRLNLTALGYWPTGVP